jgi:pantothenate kinase type III
MRILFDQGTPVPLRGFLTNHQVSTAFELGWAALANGELLAQAEAAKFNLLVTTDQNLRYQQNLTKRRIAIVVIASTSWPRIQKNVAAVVDAIERIQPGVYVEVPVP